VFVRCVVALFLLVQSPLPVVGFRSGRMALTIRIEGNITQDKMFGARYK
jgi:hypothetical protein